MKKILIVDDSASVRTAIREEVHYHDFLIKEAESGEDGLAMIEQFSPDLVTLDIEMTGIDGLETCRRLRLLPAPLGNVPVIFLTGHDSLELRFRGFEAGATEFLHKNFKEGSLLKAALDILYPERKGAKTTFLVAEDNRSIQLLVRHTLKSIASNIITASNGREAWEKFTASSGQIDCVITDYEMPEMKGDELCRLIRGDTRFKDLPVVFLSGMSDRDEILKIYRAGGSDYIIKPFIREEFIARIRVHLQAQREKTDLEEKVTDLRQTILSRNHQSREQLTGYRDSLVALVSSCENLIKSPADTALTSQKMKDIHSQGKKLLDKISRDISSDVT